MLKTSRRRETPRYRVVDARFLRSSRSVFRSNCSCHDPSTADTARGLGQGAQATLPD